MSLYWRCPALNSPINQRLNLSPVIPLLALLTTISESIGVYFLTCKAYNFGTPLGSFVATMRTSSFGLAVVLVTAFVVSTTQDDT